MRMQLVEDKIDLYNNENSLVAKEIAQDAEDHSKRMHDLYESYCDSKTIHKKLKDKYKKQREILDTEEF